MILDSLFGGTVSIRECRENDLAAMADIYADAFAYEWSAVEIEALLTGPGVKALVLDFNLFGNIAILKRFFRRSQLRGFVIYRSAADEAEILAIAVHSRQLRKGYGQMLMEEVIRNLYRNGTEKLFLEVDCQREAAVNLYKKLDFYEIGERKGYYRQPNETSKPALTMRFDFADSVS